MSYNLNILFVDDEENVLSGLRRTLFSMKNEWKMFFASSVKEALVIFENERLDVLVTDMKMPDENGTVLLKKVMQNYPYTIRIILSGHSDEKLILDSVKTAHQFILKPCKSTELIHRINKAVDLRDLLTDQNLISIITSVEKVPILSDNYISLERELTAENPSVQRIALSISKDPGISAKILQIVNSAFFNLPIEVYDITHAVNVLGTNYLKSLILYLELFEKVPRLKTQIEPLNNIWPHSLRVARNAQLIYEFFNSNKNISKIVYMAGLLHDIGYLLITQMPEYDNEIFERMQNRGMKINEAEYDWLNISHAEVGAFLLSIWNLPSEVIELVANHHKVFSINELDEQTSIYLAHKFEENTEEFYENLSELTSVERIKQLEFKLNHKPRERVVV